MEITFNKVNNQYEAEFSIENDANLHIEFSNATPIQLYQKTAGTAYGVVQGYKEIASEVVDFDIIGLVYPKNIKIVCKSNPTIAIVTVSE